MKIEKELTQNAMPESPNAESPSNKLSPSQWLITFASGVAATGATMGYFNQRNNGHKSDATKVLKTLNVISTAVNCIASFFDQIKDE